MNNNNKFFGKSLSKLSKSSNSSAKTRKKRVPSPTINTLVCHKYKLTRFINQGSFGKIFECINTSTSQIFAAKIEKLRFDDPTFYETLLLEAKILFDMKGMEGFPKMYYFLKDGEYSFMIMSLLGENLEDLFNLCKKRFSLITVGKLAVLMLDLIEKLHEIGGYVHRDIKPDNFIFDEKQEKLYLIDFGLSKKYIDSKGKHIEFNKNLNMIGTIRYTSIYSHLGYEQSRRDDLEALGYMLVLFGKGKLPWMNIPIENKTEKHKKIGEIKMSSGVEILCEGLPMEFSHFITHVRGLGFNDKPNYDFLKSLFNRFLDRCGGDNKEWDWQKKKKKNNNFSNSTNCDNIVNNILINEEENIKISIFKNNNESNNIIRKKQKQLDNNEKNTGSTLEDGKSEENESFIDEYKKYEGKVSEFMLNCRTELGSFLCDL